MVTEHYEVHATVRCDTLDEARTLAENIEVCAVGNRAHIEIEAVAVL